MSSILIGAAAAALCICRLGGGGEAFLIHTILPILSSILMSQPTQRAPQEVRVLVLAWLQP